MYNVRTMCKIEGLEHCGVLGVWFGLFFYGGLDIAVFYEFVWRSF